MKSLTIDSPIAQKVASIALFERVQKMFNLHPSKMVNDTKRMANEQNRRPSELLGDVHGRVQRAFGETLALVVVILKDRPLPTMGLYPKHTRDLMDYFNLSAVDIAEGMKEKAAIEGYDAIEAAEWLQENHWQVLEWAFAETMRVLMKEDKAA